jgi:hypothetical protein
MWRHGVIIEKLFDVTYCRFYNLNLIVSKNKYILFLEMQ